MRRGMKRVQKRTPTWATALVMLAGAAFALMVGKPRVRRALALEPPRRRLVDGELLEQSVETTRADSDELPPGMVMEERPGPV